MSKEKLAEKHGKEMWGDPALERQREYAEHSFKKGYEAHESEVKILNIPVVSNSLPDGFFFDDEHGHKVTVIGYIKEWVVVEDMHHEEPYCLEFGYIQTMYDEMVAEGNDC